MTGPYQSPPPSHQHTPAPKGRKIWKWVLIALGAMILLCGGGFAACTALVGKGINDAVEQTEADEAARAEANRKSCEGRSYPDQQARNDRCADTSGAVELNGVTVTATALSKKDGALCTTVSYRNDSDATIGFNAFDWKLQVPAGEVKDAFDTTVSDDALGSGDLIKGGTKKGSLCFEATGSGLFVLIYKPGWWGEARGIWLNEL